jgi:hypothetical protein
MLNAAYPGVHAAGLKLVTAGTAPFGDPAPGGSRIAPLRFWRAVLSRRTRFDVIAHHPYGVSGPRRHALNRDDLSVPDVHKLVSLVRRARRAGRVLASAARHVWVTELSWDSRPPDPHGVPARRHARWLGDALYLLWRQGVETVVWFQVRDQAPEPSYAETNQSGLYLHDGTPKLARRAFAFPFACERHGTRVRVWTKAPHPGAVQIRRGATVVARLRAGASRVATARIRAHGTLHAVSGTASSLSCSV